MLDFPETPEAFDEWYTKRKPDHLVEGAAFEAWLEEKQISEAKLSKIIGRPRAYVQQRRALLRGAPEVITAWREAGQITFTQARNICLASDDHDVQRKTLKMVRNRLAAGKPVRPEAIVMFAQGASQ